MTPPRWLRRQIISKKHRRRLVFEFFSLKLVEEPRMGANGLNHETHEIHEKNPEPRMYTNVHEYHLFIIRIHWLLEGCIDGCTPSLHPQLVLCHCRVVDVCPIWAGRGDGGIRLPHPHSKNRVFRSCYSCFLELIEAGYVILGYLSGNLLYCLKDN